jgi:uncharacterized membrane protein YjjP (DUF1212 family)
MEMKERTPATPHYDALIKGRENVGFWLFLYMANIVSLTIHMVEGGKWYMCVIAGLTAGWCYFVLRSTIKHNYRYWHQAGKLHWKEPE